MVVLLVYYLGTNAFFFFYKYGYLDFFEYLIITIILSRMCNPPVSYTPYYYENESLEGGFKMLTQDFEPKIS